MMLPLALALTLTVAAEPPRALGLDEALKTAAANQPTIREAQATTQAAQARADEAFAPNLPQVNLSAGYQRATANFTARPGAVPSSLSRTSNVSLDSFNYWSSGITATQTLWDFQQTWGRYRAAESTAKAQAEDELAQRVQVDLSVRTAYFQARAQRDLVAVAQATLQNQQAHLDQIKGFVEVGTRPEIDLAQAKANVANARVQLITAQNNYATAKARLNQAMGVEQPTSYDVTDSTLPPVEGEGGQLDTLVDQAYQARPESAAFERQLEAQRYTLRAVKGAYYPSLGASLGATLAGPSLDHLVPNATAQLTLSWNLYSGGGTTAQVKEAESQEVVLEAQRDAFRLQVRLDVEQAQLAVHAAQETLTASDEALAAAQDQLKLAEGRYQAGVGNVIELSDAQVGLTSASAQRVQAAYGLATARAQLLAALGRP